MPDQIYIGNFSKGLTLNRLPFNIDNDAFPTLSNAYSWRGRVKRKRGTATLGRLNLQVESVVTSTPPLDWQIGTLTTLSGAGAGSVNLLTATSATTGANIVPGSITLSDGTNTYTEPATPNGTLVGAPAGSGTINYATGAVTITGGAAAGDLIGTYSYFPSFPVMGLEEYIAASFTFPLLIAFDTEKAYQYSDANTSFYNISFYKNTNNPVTWTGQDYQQFWSTNYQNVFWATNNTPGFQFETNLTFTVGSPTVVATASAHGLITGDYVWFNEVTGADANIINGNTYSVTVTTPTTFTIALNSTALTLNNSGIFQTLTTTSPNSTGDGIKWYDGDPTSGTGLPTSTGLGWVNFAPPLTATTTSISNEATGLYYLVGALMVVPFKDRILFFSPWIQTSSGSPIQLQDTVIFSWNGTPFYNSLVPANQTYDVSAYYTDETGKGGWISAGISQAIVTLNNNEDVLLVGFTGKQTRFIYTGNDISPFLFFAINSELGSSATFSGVTLDNGGLTIGTYGIAMTDQQSSTRIDLQIPDTIFQVQAANNGVQRVSAQRDFFREWIYFTYPVTTQSYDDGTVCKFPLVTLLFNYRDNTWAILSENFTCQGTYRRQNKNTWTSIGRLFGSWAQWREPWNSGVLVSQFPNVVGGTPQGYVLKKAIGTGEAPSGSITAISATAGNITLITSYNHCVKQGDYLYVTGAVGLTGLNDQIGRVAQIPDADSFVIDIDSTSWSGTYLGNGVFSRLSQPLIQTKQFPFYWDRGRKTRLGTQKYLMDTTDNGQVTVNIYTSQNPDDAWNQGPIVPDPNAVNASLIYSQILFTCSESSNIGLTPANTNLQMPTANSQFQIWHRMNTSLIGDSVQIGITLSDEQMRNLTYATSEVTLQGIVLDVYPSQQLA